MKDKIADQRTIIENEDFKNEISDIKEEEIDSKENISNPPIQNINSNISIKEKMNKDKNISIKISESQKGKTLIKNNVDNESINKRLNNFINYSNISLHNRYYSTNTSKNFFWENFIKKLNYNKNRDNNLNDENNDIQYNNKFSNNNYYFNENQIRPYSFTSRTNNFKSNCLNKGLNYILGNANLNNINQKGKIDGYDYKKYNRGKRNNYVNKNIFFNNINNIKKFNSIPNNDILLNNNINDIKGTQIINNINNDSTQYSISSNSSKQNLILMKDIFNLNNLDINIIKIGNDILNCINKINNNFGQQIFNNNNISNMINVEPNSYEGLLKLANSHNPDTVNYYKNNSNMAYNNMGLNMNMNMKGNPFFG